MHIYVTKFNSHSSQNEIAVTIQHKGEKWTFQAPLLHSEPVELLRKKEILQFFVCTTKFSGVLCTPEDG